jgi:hypothetical protein
MNIELKILGLILQETSAINKMRSEEYAGNGDKKQQKRGNDVEHRKALQMNYIHIHS